MYNTHSVDRDINATMVLAGTHEWHWEEIMTDQRMRRQDTHSKIMILQACADIGVLPPAWIQ